MIDKLLRTELLSTVKKVMAEAMETQNERWLTGDELCKQFGMFSPSWLKAYGHKLPRERCEVDDGGTTKCSRWAYPQHKIARMIASGEIKRL